MGGHPPPFSQNTHTHTHTHTHTYVLAGVVRKDNEQISRDSLVNAFQEGKTPMDLAGVKGHAAVLALLQEVRRGWPTFQLHSREIDKTSGPTSNPEALKR